MGKGFQLVDKDYPGSGKLKCRICGEPYIDHKMEPCPELGMALVYAAPPQVTRRGFGSCAKVGCDNTARLKKNSDAYQLYCSDACRKRASMSGETRR